MQASRLAGQYHFAPESGTEKWYCPPCKWYSPASVDMSASTTFVQSVPVSTTSQLADLAKWYCPKARNNAESARSVPLSTPFYLPIAHREERREEGAYAHTYRRSIKTGTEWSYPSGLGVAQ